MSASRYEFYSAIQEFHEYQLILAPVVREGFSCKHEVHNPVLMIRVATCPDIRFPIVNALTSPLIMYSKFV